MGRMQGFNVRAASDGRSDQWVAECWTDMRRRWSRQEFVRVEDYLPQQQRSDIPSTALLDIVYGEYILSKEYGLPVDQAEYFRRFPEIEPALRRQFAVDDALSKDIPCAFESTLTGSTSEPATWAEPIPERIGKYVVVGRIGVGGQAEIFRAVHPALGKEVVLKRTRPAPDASPTDRVRLEAEARILARIEHPHLARIYDLDFHQERPFLVMEFIRGRTLEQYVQHEHPTGQQAATLVAKIARGVVVAHRHGVVHLDIKPSNVLVDDGEQPRLIDFGLAHLEDAWHEEVLEPHSLRGTLHFMAPEQARGEVAQIGCASDIFALGGLLFFLLTGQPPYPRRLDFAQLLQCCQQGQWQRDLLEHPQIPARLRQICQRAMQVEPQQRYANAELLARALEAASDARRLPRRTILAGGVVAALAAAGLAAGIYWRRQPTPVPSNASYDARLAIRVWDEDDDQYRDLEQVAPARTGDQLKISARIPPHMHYTLLSLSSDGSLAELTRGRSGERHLLFQYPSENLAVPLEGPAGTEVILLVGRQAGPVRAAQLQQLWPNPGPLAQLPDLSVLRLGPQGVTTDQRGRALGDPVTRPDPEQAVRRRLQQLQRVLEQQTDFFAAVAFSHQ